MNRESSTSSLPRVARGPTNTGTCFGLKFSCLGTSRSTTCLIRTASHIRRSAFHNQICLSPSRGTLTKTAGPEHPLASTSGGGDGRGSPWRTIQYFVNGDLYILRLEKTYFLKTHHPLSSPALVKSRSVHEPWSPIRLILVGVDVWQIEDCIRGWTRRTHSLPDHFLHSKRFRYWCGFLALDHVSTSTQDVSRPTRFPEGRNTIPLTFNPTRWWFRHYLGHDAGDDFQVGRCDHHWGV